MKRARSTKPPSSRPHIIAFRVDASLAALLSKARRRYARATGGERLDVAGPLRRFLSAWAAGVADGKDGGK